MCIRDRCSTMQDKSMEYAIRCKTSLWNMLYDARQVCGICNTMPNRSVKYAIRCQTNIPMQQHSKLYVHIECRAWRVPVSTEGSTRTLALTSTAQCTKDIETKSIATFYRRSISDSKTNTTFMFRCKQIPTSRWHTAHFTFHDVYGYNFPTLRRVSFCLVGRLF